MYRQHLHDPIEWIMTLHDCPRAGTNNFLIWYRTPTHIHAHSMEVVYVHCKVPHDIVQPMLLVYFSYIMCVLSVSLGYVHSGIAVHIITLYKCKTLGM